MNNFGTIGRKSRTSFVYNFGQIISEGSDRQEQLMCVKTFRYEGTWWVARKFGAAKSDTGYSHGAGVDVTYDGVYSEECQCVPINELIGRYSSQGLCPENTTEAGGCPGVPAGFTDECGTFCHQKYETGFCFDEKDCTCYKSRLQLCNGRYYYQESGFPPIINPPENQYTWVEGQRDHGHALECLDFYADADQWNQLCSCKGIPWTGFGESGL